MKFANGAFSVNEFPIPRLHAALELVHHLSVDTIRPTNLLLCALAQGEDAIFECFAKSLAEDKSMEDFIHHVETLFENQFSEQHSERPLDSFTDSAIQRGCAGVRLTFQFLAGARYPALIWCQTPYVGLARGGARFSKPTNAAG